MTNLTGEIRLGQSRGMLLGVFKKVKKHNLSVTAYGGLLCSSKRHLSYANVVWGSLSDTKLEAL